MTIASQTIGPESTMREVLEAYPGAQRALFRQYHIGGCSHCSFQPDETFEQLCRRNENLDPKEVLESIKASHDEDQKILIEPKDLATWLAQDKSIRLVDVRSREEFEAAHIPGSVLLSQDVMREIMSSGSNSHPLVVIDHRGAQGLDAAAYFKGHGLQNVRCLRGGIDAWSTEVDAGIRRYSFQP